MAHGRPARPVALAQPKRGPLRFILAVLAKWPRGPWPRAPQARVIETVIGVSAIRILFFRARILIPRGALAGGQRGRPAWDGDPPGGMDWTHPLPPIRRGPKIYRTQKLRGTAASPNSRFPPSNKTLLRLVE